VTAVPEYARTGAEAAAKLAENLREDQLAGLGTRANAGMYQRLELEELASEAETSIERIRRLVEIGAVIPTGTGSSRSARSRSAASSSRCSCAGSGPSPSATGANRNERAVTSSP
jgi:hypothetical protein